MYTAFFQNIGTLTSLLPLFLFLIFFKRNNRIEIRVILFYCCYSVINDFILLTNENNPEYGGLIFFLLSLFTIIEYLCFSAVIFLLMNSSVFKRIIIYITPLFIIYSIYQYLIASSYIIDSLTITIENIIILSFCILFFFEQISKPEVTFIYFSYKFWLVLAILIYSTGTFFLFMYSSTMSNEQWEDWSLINSVFSILKNAFFSIAIIMKKDNSDNNYLKKPFNEDIFGNPMEIDHSTNTDRHT